MGGRWHTRRRSQTRIEENHTDRHHEKVGYLATDSSGRSGRARYSIRNHTTGRCSFLKFVRRAMAAQCRQDENSVGWSRSVVIVGGEADLLSQDIHLLHSKTISS